MGLIRKGKLSSGQIRWRVIWDSPETDISDKQPQRRDVD